MVESLSHYCILLWHDTLFFTWERWLGIWKQCFTPANRKLPHRLLLKYYYFNENNWSFSLSSRSLSPSLSLFSLLPFLFFLSHSHFCKLLDKYKCFNFVSFEKWALEITPSNELSWRYKNSRLDCIPNFQVLSHTNDFEKAINISMMEMLWDQVTIPWFDFDQNSNPLLSGLHTRSVMNKIKKLSAKMVPW